MSSEEQAEPDMVNSEQQGEPDMVNSEEQEEPHVAGPQTAGHGPAEDGPGEPEVVGAAFLRRQWDRVAAWGCVVVGAMALLIGWSGVSDTPFAAEQIPYVISGGIGGVFFLGVGAMLWISADLHDEWRKLDEIEDLLEEQLAVGLQRTTTGGLGAAPAPADGGEDDWTDPSAGNGRGATGNRTRRPVRARD